MTMHDGGDRNAEVLPFRTSQGPHLDLALAKIETYWTEVRRGRLVPSRSEIDPRGLEGVLKNAFILERLTTGLARIRISGSHMTDFLGMEARGLPLSTVFTNDCRETLADAIQAVFDEPASVRFSITSESGFGRPELNGHMVLLPLRSDLGDITRVLGGVSLQGGIGRTPRRLTITGQTRRSLIGYSERPGTSTGLSGSFQPQVVTPRKSSSPPRNSPRVRSDHLRLVVVNDD